MSAVLAAVLVGVLFAAGVHQLLQRGLVRLVFGIALIGHAVNLLIFLGAGIVRGRAPLAEIGAATPPPGSADPVPQALVLTAIVIGFALVAFTAVLVRAVVVALGTDDVDRMRGEAR